MTNWKLFEFGLRQKALDGRLSDWSAWDIEDL